MQPLLIVIVGVVGCAITLWGVRSVLRSNFGIQAPNPLSVVLIAAGLWLFFFRAITVAIALLILGAVLLSRQSGGPASRHSTQTSKVRSAYLEMMLDHETGAIDGQILMGKRQGQFLSNLALDDLLLFHAEVRTDEESLQLFETFLDSAHPDWRDQESAARCRETSPLSSHMSREEAHELLGLEAGCSDEDVRRAYHRLIKRVHPDSGGTAALMARITEARDMLLGEGH